jgi:hypothetical protein
MLRRELSIVKIPINGKTKSELHMMKYEFEYDTMQQLYEAIFENGITHMRNKKRNGLLKRKGVKSD